ncbi:4'-phosphopantetheinyl transferase [Streptomyces sp. NPDC058623]|uniref:4'-phosphopantetheinyl transferase family protein n=1 Tax=Streptomyces sp. NPDC058623 TaxID=3346563 RepID=UPI00364BFE88
MESAIRRSGPQNPGALFSRLLRQVGVSTAEDVPRAGETPPALYPVEEAAAVRFVPRRHAEFAATRALARRALADLGVAPGPLPVGRAGGPDWPPGVVGSLTHCPTWRAAVVARRADVHALGIDVEQAVELRHGLLERICVNQYEVEAIRTLTARHEGIPFGKVLFSAKEAVFKTWAPLTGMRLEFRQAEITLRVTGSDTGSFRVRFPAMESMANAYQTNEIRGKWIIRKGVVATAAFMIA